MNTWRFIPPQAFSPAENMAIDEAILIAHSERKAPPTVRFYGWNPPTLSIGYFQKAEDEVNFAGLKSRGIGFVRRPTGGRAVLHDAELTYSLIVSEDYPGMSGSVTEAYRILSEGLLHGFRRLDLDARMVNLADEQEKMKYAAAGSAACFDSPSWYELVVEGKKVAGSAQVRQKGVVLQHGSILMELDSALLFSLLQFPNERVRERLEKSFSQKAVAINDIRRSAGAEPVSFEQVSDAFYHGFSQGLEAVLQPRELSAYERELTEQLVVEKYANRDWNFRR